MKQTGDLNLVKKINKSLVLEHIRMRSPISRAGLAGVTGLTKATVSNLVNELIDDKLVNEIGTGQSSGGRKPMMLLFNGSAGYAAGVDLGIDYIAAVLTDLNGTVVHEKRVVHGNTAPEAIIADLKTCIRDIAVPAKGSVYGVVGIGIGIPGISDAQGNVLFAPNLGWQNVPLQQSIEKEFGIPVVIDNEANAGAVGEQRFGSVSGINHLVYVSLGAGIGTGVLIKGDLYRGASGFSGEFGHVTIEYEGKRCLCGNSGCWELYASENALLSNARAAYPGLSVTVDGLMQMADAGDPGARRLFAQLGHYLGIGLVTIINGWNPEAVIIGGRLAAAEKWLRQPMLDAMTERSLPYPRSGLSVRFSELGMQSTVLGACSFAIKRFFAAAKVSMV